jgi:signal transduction histidine kinase
MRLLTPGPFIPHGHCYLWNPELVGLHVVSDALIALAYYSIPLTLVYFVRKRQDLPFIWVFLLFGCFIIACGTTHLIAIWTLWYPNYWISGLVKLATAFVSLYTALELVPLIPKALALPSPAQLKVANEELRHNIAERQRAEASLQKANDELETKVRARTIELARANDELKLEIAQRQQVEKELRSSEERFRILSGKLIEAQEAERRHIARELHDEIGQALTAVKINLQAIQRSSHDEIVSPLNESIGIAEIALQQVRSLSLNLRPSVLDDLGLLAALRWYLDRQSQRGGFVGELIAEPPATQLSSHSQTTCFRIIQEALNNVVRHAKAQKVTVKLQQHEAQIYLAICDDGIGFDVQVARVRARLGESLGLLGMEERVLLSGGQMTIESILGSGTKIQVWLPLTT